VPQIVYRENGRVKTRYVTKEERESIEQLKITNNYKTLKEAYFRYKHKLIPYPEQIRRLEVEILELKNKIDELKEALKVIGEFDG